MFAPLARADKIDVVLFAHLNRGTVMARLEKLRVVRILVGFHSGRASREGAGELSLRTDLVEVIVHELVHPFLVTTVRTRDDRVTSVEVFYYVLGLNVTFASEQGTHNLGLVLRIARRGGYQGICATYRTARDVRSPGGDAGRAEHMLAIEDVSILGE